MRTRAPRRPYSAPAGGVTVTSSTEIPGRATIEIMYPATSDGRIIKSGPKELALELEAKGYDWVKEHA